MQDVKKKCVKKNSVWYAVVRNQLSRIIFFSCIFIVVNVYYVYLIFKLLLLILSFERWLTQFFFELIKAGFWNATVKKIYNLILRCVRLLTLKAFIFFHFWYTLVVFLRELLIFLCDLNQYFRKHCQWLRRCECECGVCLLYEGEILLLAWNSG